MSDKKNPYGYDAVDEVSTKGKFLSFKKGDKDREIQMRLVSEPRYINQHWIKDTSGKDTTANCEGDKCNYCGVDVPKKEKIKKDAKWGWIVIHRAEKEGEEDEVKMFTGPTTIARSIKDLSELMNKRTGKVMWGDPTSYDILIKRTEIPGAGYYKVDPVPDTREPLSEKEVAMIAEADINLEEEKARTKKSDNTGSYGGATPSLETAPEKEEEVEVPEELSEAEKEELPEFLR